MGGPPPRRHEHVLRHEPVQLTRLRQPKGGGGPHSSHFHLGTENLPGQPGAWILSAGTVNAVGQATTTAPAPCTTRQSEESTHAFIECLASQGIRESVAYQPASRYWTFQWAETAIYLAVALALSGYCFWRLSRRLT